MKDNNIPARTFVNLDKIVRIDPWSDTRCIVTERLGPGPFAVKSAFVENADLAPILFPDGPMKEMTIVESTAGAR